MKLNPNPKRGFTLVELLVVIAIIAALAALSAPMIMGQVKRADRTEAINNAKQIGIALFSFQEEYGSHPDGGDTGTQKRVEANNEGSEIEADTESSNGYFRQLFIAGVTESETMFYAKTGFTVKPDGVLEGTTLSAGECGFGYIMNGEEGLTTAGNPSRVSAVTPLDDEGKFSIEPFDKKAVCLRMDNSASALTINAEGDVVLGGGKTLLEAGPGTIWGASTTPEIIQPEY